MTYFKPRDCAKVVLSGRTFYLGPWKSQQARAKYDRLVRVWLASGRSWVDHDPEPEPPIQLDPANPGVLESLDQLVTLYLEQQEELQSRTTFLNNRRALMMLLRSGVAKNTTPADFGPRRLKAFQVWLTGNPARSWSRETINEYVAIVVRMFRWAAAEEYLDADVWQRLRAVPGLRRGRAAIAGAQPAREGRKVRPPQPGAVEAVKPLLPPIVRAMVELQLVTGMRPNEVCFLHPGALTPTSVAGVTAYTVPQEANKGEWRGLPRTVYIGPRGLAILKPYLDRPAEAFCFSPREGEAERMQARRESRKSKRWPSHDPLRRATRRGDRARLVHDRYAPTSYARAIRRACEAANRERAAKGIEPIEPWFPYQLRHAAASAITAAESIEVAQILLGHRSIETTIGYVEVKGPRAAQAAKKLG